MVKKLILSICLIFVGIIAKAQISDTLLVYPNPFQDTATIEFHIYQTDTVSLNVYNTVGVNVRPYFQDSIFLAGTYSNLFIGNGLISGLYFVKLKINDTILTKKVIKNGGATVLIEYESNNSNFYIFPNPTSNLFNINYTLSYNCKTQIQILNSLGQIIKEVSDHQMAGNHSHTFDTKNYSNGIYFIRFSDGVNSRIEKIVVF